MVCVCVCGAQRAGSILFQEEEGVMTHEREHNNAHMQDRLVDRPADLWDWFFMTRPPATIWVGPP